MNGNKYKNKYKSKDNNTKKIKSNNLNIDDKNVETFLSSDSKGWKVNDMFKINSQITGKKFEYDGIVFNLNPYLIQSSHSIIFIPGNPHQFGSSHPRFVNYNSHIGSNEISSDELQKNILNFRFFPQFNLDSKAIMKEIEVHLK
jgi:hypothetical protein